jgi:hypothetical protein
VSKKSPVLTPAPITGRRIQTRRSGVHGKGVFALSDFAKGETIIEYVGEIITWKEALRRHPHDPKDPNHTLSTAATLHVGSTTRANPTASLTKSRAASSSKRYATSKLVKS